MATIADIIDFRQDLFFDGAVQIDWFETNPEKRDKAAANFVFHGPEYFGVDEADKKGAAAGYSLTDTVTLTAELIDAVDPEKRLPTFLAQAIAGYGAGKSHFALTLATLLSNPRSSVAKEILSGIERADKQMGAEIRRRIESWPHPVLVIPLNGMNGFNLSEELCRQVLVQLRAHGLDTLTIEDLWPRFQSAEIFVSKNFDYRRDEFARVFGPDTEKTGIIEALRKHNEACFQKVNEIHDVIVGEPIRVIGAESPKQLIDTLCREYCGESGPFQSVLILFDEFGAFLEFAVNKPYIAGEAAIQQIFEGVQDNSTRCFMLCAIQYALNAYTSRVAPEKQDAIKRYIGRYDAAKKYYLSSNLETLFAHLIQKRNPEFIEQHLFSDGDESQWEETMTAIRDWAPYSQTNSVWREKKLFRQVILKGCWPLHPMTTLFLFRLKDQLQQDRRPVTIVKDILEDEYGRRVDELPSGWAIPATWLFRTQMGTEDRLLRELLDSERYGAVAHSYSAVIEKNGSHLEDDERQALLATLIQDKMGLKISDQSQTHKALSCLSGLSIHRIEPALRELEKEYGVLEWNKHLSRYEIISEGIPRSKFTKFLDRRAQEIPSDKIRDLFAVHIRKWADLPKLREIDPEFGIAKQISSSEWRFKTFISHRGRIQTDIDSAVKDWRDAVAVDEPKGQLLYCYIEADADPQLVQNDLAKYLDESLGENTGCAMAPVFVVLIHDGNENLRRILSEYHVLNSGLSPEEENLYRNFIEDQKQRLKDDLQYFLESMIRERLYVFPRVFSGEPLRREEAAFAILNQTYPETFPFPFDGFHTAKGNAAKDCRAMTVELFKGTLDYEWYTTQNPQMQNRIAAVLREAWQIFDDAGKVAWRPRHPRLRDTIQLFEERLEVEESINLGELFQFLVKPPYGLNIASAGLVIGIFLSPRLKSTALIHEGSSKAPSIWISDAFGGNFLKNEILIQTDIQHVETDEWEELLGKWSSEPTHDGRISYLTEAERLKQRVPLPAGALFERYKYFADKAVQSIQGKKDYEKFLEKQRGHFEKALAKEDVKSLSWVGKDLVDMQKMMQKSRERWTADQFQEVSVLIEDARKAVIDCFDEWLEYQSILTAQQTGSFQHEMNDLVGGNLRTLGLKTLNQKLEGHVQKIVGNIEKKQEISYAVNAADAFLKSHPISRHVKVSELTEWIGNADKLIQNLERARAITDAPEIDGLIERTESFKQSAQSQRKSQRSRYQEFFDRNFSTIESIREAAVEIKDLMGIFSGEEIETEELAKMNERLNRFENDFSTWKDLNVSNEELETIIRDRIKETTAAEEADEEIEWRDAKEIYENFLERLLSLRKERSSKWLDQIYHSPEKISEMDGDTCQSLFSRIEPFPIYISPENRKTAEEMRSRLQHRLEELKIDGLLAMFRGLPKNLQQKFYGIIASEI